MKANSFYILGLALLAGCQFVPAGGRSLLPASLPPGCGTPGTVNYTYFVKASDDFPYEFGIYLPPCYDAAAGAAYPVIYLLPGKGGGRKDWFNAGTAQIADDLILTGEMPPFIIVTSMDVGNGPDPNTITDELVPYIESHYPILPERRYHAVAGASAGGSAAYDIGFRFPERYAAIGMFGMGLSPGDEDRVRTWLAAMPPEDRPRVFMNCGTQDVFKTVDLAYHMMAQLDEAGLAHTHIFTPGIHSLSYWISNLPAFLQWVALDWQ